MREYIEKAKGLANDTIGKAKIELGRATDSPALVLDGVEQRVKGQLQVRLGTLAGAESEAAETIRHAELEADATLKAKYKAAKRVGREQVGDPGDDTGVGS
jgi:uncharacterized protein YjbJ (UPF0337 family)